MSDKPAYSHKTDKASFEILPTIYGGYLLKVDDQICSFFARPEHAAESCSFGHISTVISAKGGVAPYWVRTRGEGIPQHLTDWKCFKTEPVEL